MNISPIITDFDDQDAYKFFMQYAAFKQHPDAIVKYKFINRGEHKFPNGFGEELKKQIEYMKDLRFNSEIESFFRSEFKTPNGISYFDEGYYGFLRGFRYKPEQVSIKQYGDELEVEAEGPWIEAIFWETQVMPIISELYYVMTGQNLKIKNREERKKHNTLKFQGFITLGVNFADFSLRRRFSKSNQEEMIKDAIKVAPNNFVGTSNVMFARKFKIRAIGTQAHEWIMFHAAKYGVDIANSMAAGKWVDTFHGALGTALTDTFGSTNFYQNFGLFYSKLFDGVRHDSGCPLKFTDMTVAHYKSMGINPLHKLIVFSDGINSFDKIKSIVENAFNKIKSSFGIGTWLGNDVGVSAMNMVIKLFWVRVNETRPWVPCVKLGDGDGGKAMGGTNEAIEMYKKEINYEQS